MLLTKLYTEVSKDLQVHIAVLIYKQWPDLYANKDIAEIVESFKNLHKCWVFYNDEEIVGTAGINIDTPVPTFNTNYWICNLYVIESQRGKHMGEKILKIIEQNMQLSGVNMLNLWCEQNLIEFYKKYQWNLTPDAHPDKPDSKIMIKML
jgi:predicted acetyltransferase